MHTTESSKKIRNLKTEAKKFEKMARIARQAAPIVAGAETEAQTLEKDAQYDLAMAQGLKAQARLEDLSLWVMEKTYPGRKGTTTNQYWMASWREGKTVHNVHLGSCRKVSAEEARAKAHELKAQAMDLPVSNS
ncbi:MAG: hypothetical protein WCW68_00525 [Methanothrix sp.]|jgi:hypothetical protein